MKSIIKFFFLSTVYCMLSGCHTVQGVGKDIQTVGGSSPDTTTTTTTTVKTVPAETYSTY